MDASISQYVAFGLAALLIGISKAGFGGGMGILVGPMLTIFFGARQSVGWMLPLLFLCDCIALAYYWRQWDLRNIRNLLPGGILGICLGAFALNAIDDKSLARLIGVLAIFFSLLQFARIWLKRDRAVEPRFWHGFPVGLATGFVSTLSHVGGLLTSIYLLLQHIDNRRFVATTTLFYFWINLLKMPVFWHLGVMNEQTLWRNVPYAPMVFVGTFVGVMLNRRVPEKWFAWIIQLSVLAIGIYLAAF